MGIGDHHHWHSSSYVDGWIDGAADHDEQRRPLLHQAARLLPFASCTPGALPAAASAPIPMITITSCAPTLSCRREQGPSVLATGGRLRRG